MKNDNLKPKIVILLAALASSLFIAAPLSYAQTATNKPQVILTWKALTYTPPDFMGKILPTSNSRMAASVALVDGGRIVDISRETIYWYLNDNFLNGSVGLQDVSFNVPNATGGAFDLRAEITTYSKGNQLKTVSVPVVNPEAVIELPFPSGIFYSSLISLFGQPYFFNVDDPSKLNFAWSVNGQTPSGAENPQSLNIKFGSVPSGSNLYVSLRIQNPSNQFESGAKSANLTYSTR